MLKGIGTRPDVEVLGSGYNPTRILRRQEKNGRDAKGTRSYRYATPDGRPLHWHLEGSSGGIPSGEIACMRIRNNSFGADHPMFSCARTSSRFSRRRSAGGDRHGHASHIHADVCVMMCMRVPIMRMYTFLCMSMYILV